MRLSVWRTLLLCLPLASFAADLPELVIPAGVGVNIHFVTGHTKDLDAIAAAGFKFVRMDFSWGGTERVKGEYDWKGYGELLNNLDKRAMRALFILDYSNPLYEETVISKNPIDGRERKNVRSPQTPESVAAFAKWAGEAARHFKDRRVIWEIWNEPNIHFWSPKPDVQQYIALAKAACEQIRAVDPKATIIGPATSEFPWEFLTECFKAGLLKDWDAVSVHPYRNYARGPETAGPDYQRLRESIAGYVPPAKRDAPPAILSGEWGYATHEKGVSLETQAAFAVRQQLANLFNRVPLSIWYDWKNDGEDPKEREHNFGTVYPDLRPKPAYQAIQTLTRELSGYALDQRFPFEDESIWVLLFKNAEGKRKIAAWTTGEPKSCPIRIGAPSNNHKAVDYLGKPVTLDLASGLVQVELKQTPIYFTVGTSSLQLR